MSIRLDSSLSRTHRYPSPMSATHDGSRVGVDQRRSAGRGRRTCAMSWMRSCTWPRRAPVGDVAERLPSAFHQRYFYDWRSNACWRASTITWSWRPGSSRGRPERRGDRQPERENHGKRWCSGLCAGKKIKGRKRHVTDTLALIVHAADGTARPRSSNRSHRTSSPTPPTRDRNSRAPLRSSAASRSSSAQTPPRASSS